MSRLVCWAPVFNAGAMRVFVKQMRQQAEFCGMEVITHCVMANHFHVLVRVPEVERSEVSDTELVRRFRILYPKRREGQFQATTAEVLERSLAEGGETAEALRTELLARMHDVSVFMKELKQRFSIWYNHRYDRHGTLWSERFKSVLVEGKRTALKTVSAYIDLNPVRAGLVGDPKDYAWSGYGAACGGDRAALWGLARVLGGRPGSAESLRRALADYRVLLYGKGALPGLGKPVCLDPEAARKVREAGGELPLSSRLLCRARVMWNGIALGSRDYVADVEVLYRKGFGRKRKRDPVAILDDAGEELCALKGS